MIRKKKKTIREKKQEVLNLIFWIDKNHPKIGISELQAFNLAISAVKFPAPDCKMSEEQLIDNFLDQVKTWEFYKLYQS